MLKVGFVGGQQWWRRLLVEEISGGRKEAVTISIPWGLNGSFDRGFPRWRATVVEATVHCLVGEGSFGWPPGEDAWEVSVQVLVSSEVVGGRLLVQAWQPPGCRLGRDHGGKDNSLLSWQT
ncbi:hypothetical protein V6N13_148240 [Hibiscus sabdariffa]